MVVNYMYRHIYLMGYKKNTVTTEGTIGGIRGCLINFNLKDFISIAPYINRIYRGL